MFFLAKGDCEVFVNDEYRRRRFVDLIRSGRHFGEIALLYNTLRTATVRARNYSTIAVLNKEGFEELRVGYPQVIKKFKNLTQQYKNPYKKFILKMV